jgi:hypothetical protein
MAIAKEDRDFLRGINRRVADQALEPNDPLYEPIYEQLDADDPVAIMQARIELSDVQTMQLFSGFSGAGKTTELFRLRRNLLDAGGRRVQRRIGARPQDRLATSIVLGPSDGFRPAY